MVAAAMNLPGASGALGTSGALVEQRARPAAHKIAQMAVEASRPLALVVAATNYSVGMVVVQGPVEATHSPVASKAVVEANLQFVAVAVARDWPAVEGERSRRYHKSGHHRVEPLHNWRIVAYW